MGKMKSYQTTLFALFIALVAFGILPVKASAAQMPWNVRNVESNGTPILNITDAVALLSGQIESRSDVNGQYAVVNFNLQNGPKGGLFPGDSNFPGVTPGHHKDFATEITGKITIPAAGAYTFGVSSDDGFLLQIGSFVSGFSGLRSPGESYATFNFNQPGDYDTNLVFFQHHVHAELELFASPGTYSEFRQAGSNFHLVGDSTIGALHTSVSPIVTAVPEPTGIALLAPLMLGLLRRRRN
jgi:hypothetical protein